VAASSTVSKNGITPNFPTPQNTPQIVSNAFTMRMWVLVEKFTTQLTNPHPCPNANPNRNPKIVGW